MSDDLKFKITTQADTSGAQAAKKSLDEVAKAEQGVASAAKQMEQATAAASGSGSSGFGKLVEAFKAIKADGVQGLAALGPAAAKLVGPLAAVVSSVLAIKAAYDQTTESVKKYAAAQESSARFDTALAKTGQLTDETREKFEKLIKSQADITKAAGYGKMAWEEAATTLIKFGSTGETAAVDLKAVENAAGLMGTGVEEAATMVAKAMQGNFMMFGRYGLHVNEAGTQTEKLTELYRKLAEMGGGQLASANETLAGSWRKVEAQSGALKKAIGQQIAEFLHLKEGQDRLAYGLEILTNMFSKPIARLETLRNSVSNTAKEMERGEQTTARYAKAQEAVAESAKKANEELQKQKSLLDFQKSLDQKRVDATKEFELAQVEDLEKRKKISHVEAAKRRNEIEQSAATASFNIEQEVLNKKEKLNSDAINRALTEKKQLDSAVKQLEGIESGTLGPLDEASRARKVAQNRQTALENARPKDGLSASQQIQWAMDNADAKEKAARITEEAIKKEEALKERLQRETGMSPEEVRSTLGTYRNAQTVWQKTYGESVQDARTENGQIGSQRRTEQDIFRLKSGTASLGLSGALVGAQASDSSEASKRFEAVNKAIQGGNAIPQDIATAGAESGKQLNAIGKQAAKALRELGENQRDSVLEIVKELEEQKKTNKLLQDRINNLRR